MSALLGSQMFYAIKEAQRGLEPLAERQSLLPVLFLVEIQLGDRRIPNIET